MTDSKSAALTRLVHRAAAGDPDAMRALIEQLYGELHGLARGYLRGDASNQTLQPTALVNELYLRLAGHEGAAWADREHFMAVAATAMRQILADYARRKRAKKRGLGWERVTLVHNDLPDERSEVDMVALDQVLARLEDHNPRHAELVVLRVFGGLTVPEAANVLGVSARTVNNDWRFVKAWMRRELSGER